MTKFKGLILNVCSTNLIICPKNTSVCSRLVIRKPCITNVCQIVLGCIRGAAVLSAQWFSYKVDLIWYKWVQCVFVLLFSPLFFLRKKIFVPLLITQNVIISTQSISSSVISLIQLSVSAVWLPLMRLISSFDNVISIR